MESAAAGHGVSVQEIDAHIAQIVQTCNTGKPPEALKAVRALSEKIGRDGLLDCFRISLPETLPVNLAINLGRALADLFPPVRDHVPAGASPAGRTSDNSLCVIGTSHARSFGAHPAIFPLFLGVGRSTLVLDEEVTAQTLEKFDATARRLDPDTATLVVLGGEPRFQYGKEFGSGEKLAPAPTDEDLANMDACAERYFRVRDVVCRYVRAPVGLYGALPTHDRMVNRLTERLNKRLAELCADHGVPFVSVADRVSGDDGLLDRNYAASSFKDDFHLNFDALPFIVEAVNRSGLVSLDENAERYDWRYVFSFPFGDDENTRIWNEPDVSPANALTSEKIAATQVTMATLPYLLSHLATQAPRRLLVVNASEGLAPIGVPPELVRETVAWTASPASAGHLRRIAGLVGRPDIEVLSAPPETGGPDDVLVGLTFPDSAATDNEAIRAAAESCAPADIFLLGANITVADDLAALGYGCIAQFEAGNRHLPASWQATRVAHFRRPAG